VIADAGFWVPRILLSRFVDSALKGTRRPPTFTSMRRLSRREGEVMQLLLQNLSNKEIASQLHISSRTAKFHVSNLLAKHGVRRRADLILLAHAQAEP
jgi:DNA-binding NarL/FixJ family response regulator